jgi:transposase
LQPDFKDQRSLVQEVIESVGHLCIFLPKFHCELNFIEFFWGAVKKYLRENCDYTFETLKANLPSALASVDLCTIRRWEHRMIQWMDAYCSGLGAKEAQLQVKKFSSKCYTSH